MRVRLTYLLRIGISRSNVPISLAVDRRITAAADGVHLPRSEVVVNNMNVSPSAPGHPLNKLLAEQIKRNRHLHPRVRREAVVVP